MRHAHELARGAPRAIMNSFRTPSYSFPGRDRADNRCEGRPSSAARSDGGERPGRVVSRHRLCCGLQSGYDGLCRVQHTAPALHTAQCGGGGGHAPVTSNTVVSWNARQEIVMTELVTNSNHDPEACLQKSLLGSRPARAEAAGVQGAAGIWSACGVVECCGG